MSFPNSIAGKVSDNLNQKIVIVLMDISREDRPELNPKKVMVKHLKLMTVMKIQFNNYILRPFRKKRCTLT